MHHHLLRPKPIILVLLSLVLSSCTSGPARQSPGIESREVVRDQQTNNKPQASIYRELEQDQSSPYSERQIHIERAEHFDQLANQQDGKTEQHRATLSAAEHYIQAGNYQKAGETLDTLARLELDADLGDRYDVIDAYVMHANGRHQVALIRLGPLLDAAKQELERRQSPIELSNPGSSVAATNKTQIIDALLLSSLSNQALLQFEPAIDALIKREILLEGSVRAETARYTSQVINSLSAEQKLEVIERTVNPLVRNRIRQSYQVTPMNEVVGFENAPSQFDRWRDSSTRQSSRQIINAEWNAQSPKSIAVLLPFSSKYEKAAHAAKDGIEYAHQQNQSPYRPNLEFYDIGENPLLAGQHYMASLRTGADMVIGPIAKSYANQVTIAAQSVSNAPTILLGGDAYLEHSRGARNRFLYRLTMSPEAEARTVAERALKEGFVTAAVMIPNTLSGKRAEQAFLDEWQAVGGLVSNVIHYSDKQFDHSVELRSLFNINASEQRHAQISKTLGFKPKFSAIRRHDIDFVFLVANNKTGRILRPQINFFSGKKVPVLSTSGIYNGIPNAVENLDLELTRFPVMPWILHSAESAPYAGQLNMLFAMGADAYKLAAQYKSFRSNPNYQVNGNSGLLHVEANGEVIYQPVWARFIDGLATPYQSLPALDSLPTSNKSAIMQSDSLRSDQGARTYNESNWNPRSPGGR